MIRSADARSYASTAAHGAVGCAEPSFDAGNRHYRVRQRADRAVCSPRRTRQDAVHDAPTEFLVGTPTSRPSPPTALRTPASARSQAPTDRRVDLQTHRHVGSITIRTAFRHPVQHLDSVNTSVNSGVNLHQLFWETGETRGHRGESRNPSISPNSVVPRDGVEPPTRGFSVPSHAFDSR